MRQAAGFFSMLESGVVHRAGTGRLPPFNRSKYLRWMGIGDSAESGLRRMAAALGRSHEAG
jgi:hypothetical protein